MKLQHNVGEEMDCIPTTSEKSEINDIVYFVRLYGRREEVDQAIDMIFTKNLEWMNEGRFDLIDCFLKNFDPVGLDASIVLAPLAITVPIADKLSERVKYFLIARAELAYNKRHELEDLFAGLE